MEGTLGYNFSRIYTAAEITANSPNSNIPKFGTRSFDGSTGKAYIFMKATTAWTAGDFIVRNYAGANEPFDGEPCSAVAQPIAGVANSTVPVNGAGWVQVEGEIAAANVAASTAGQFLGTTATTGRATGIVASAGANPTQAEATAFVAALQSVRATALDVAAANLCQVYLN